MRTAALVNSPAFYESFLLSPKAGGALAVLVGERELIRALTMENLPKLSKADAAFFGGGGVAGALVRSTDWSETPLGPIATWPTSLKITVATILHARHPMFLWWSEELIQFYNDAYLPSFGEGKHPLAMGQPGRECWQEIWPIIWPQIDGVMSGAKATWNEDALVPIFRNGRLEDVYWTYGYSPVFNDDGSIGGTLVVCTETTPRVVAERALMQMSESLATTLDSIGAGVVASDLSGAIVRMNRAAEELTGWTLSEAKGKRANERVMIVDEDTRARREDPVTETLRDGSTIPLLERSVLVRRDGAEIPIGGSCSPITSKDGTVHGAVVVLRDLTAHRKAEATKKKLQEHLIIADRMASVGTLAAGVAHEINNPLTYVAANIETTLEDVRRLAGESPATQVLGLEPRLLESLEGLGRIAKIVRGLVTFSRVEEEKRSVIALVPVLDLAVDMAFNEIRHRARLVKDYGELPTVDADDARLGQVFLNLLVNAAQAFDAHRADSDEIRIVARTDDMGRAVVEVSDTGAGISAVNLSRIFDPFFTTKAVGTGTGLGLAICHNIVTGMGGEISVRSELGHGATFSVVLPASRVTAHKPVAPEHANAASSPARVLVVDDEPAIGVVVRRILRGHDVTVVTSGSEALAMLAGGKRFDVILSDLMMPAMSGMDLYGALGREHPDMLSRVVFVTGGAFTSEGFAFLNRVANQRLEKPLDFKRLRATVQGFSR